MAPRITVGLPVYQGADLVGKALECLRLQTFSDFEVVISVDGGDRATAAACEPFLADPRFRMIVQKERLDWVGNFNWLLKQELGEFFCYRQHDDESSLEFFSVLMEATASHPDAAAVYCDCRFGGARGRVESAASIDGEPFDRVIHYIRTMASAAPARGLIRSAAIHAAGPVRSDEFRAPMEIFVWLARLLRWGSFMRVAEPLYYRLDHPKSFTSAFYRSPGDRKRAVWTTLFTGLIEATAPLCHTQPQRRLMQTAIVDRVVLFPTGSAYQDAERFFSECIDRLRFEAKADLIEPEEQAFLLGRIQRELQR